MTKPSNQLDRDKCAEAAQVCACFHFRRASRAVTQLYDQVLQQVGLRSTQFVVLVAIFLNEPTNASTLSNTLVLDRSTLSRNLRPLEEDGLVKVQGNRGRQSQQISLTAKGRKLVSKAIPLWEKAQNQFVSHLGEENWVTMLNGLQQAVDATRAG